jgi:hypothetical protein
MNVSCTVPFCDRWRLIHGLFEHVKQTLTASTYHVPSMSHVQKTMAVFSFWSVELTRRGPGVLVLILRCLKILASAV